MQIGVHLPHIGRKATPEVVTRAAVQAEELGLADVWVSEHVILPKDAPYPPSPAFLFKMARAKRRALRTPAP